MKRVRKGLTFFLLFNLLGCMLPGFAFSASNGSADIVAQKLSQIGMFKGTNNGFELDREPTRLEGLTMLIRLLGKEAEANKKAQEQSQFSDVPTWGGGYVNYASQSKLAYGVDEGRFGTDDKMSAIQYVTLVLRALGYSDANGDFQYDKALQKAVSIGLLDGATQTGLTQGKFTRGQVADISYAALKQLMKDSPSTLAQKLVDEGAISRANAQSIGVLADGTSGEVPNGKVTFADPALEQVVRAQINKPSGDIYSQDVSRITTLDARAYPHARIRKLDGIEAMYNLTQLSLSSNLIDDVRPLTGLTQLKGLNVADNRIEDVTPLRGMSSLENLQLSSNFIYKMDALSGLTNLKSLDISYNGLTDISSVKEMHQLGFLNVSGNAISNIEILRTMPALTSVSIYENPVADTSPIIGKSGASDQDLHKIEEAGKIAQSIIQSTIRTGMTDPEKETALHDYVIDWVTYDNQYFSTRVPTKTSPVSMYGALVEQYAVCEGYARTMTTLGRMAGLDILYIRGDTGGIPHAWNMIRLDGTYYHVDATLDDTGALWGGKVPATVGAQRLIDFHKRLHFNLTHNKQMYSIRWDFDLYPMAKQEAPEAGSNQLQVSVNAEVPINRDMIVWLYLDLRYTDNDVYTGKSVQFAKAIASGTTKFDVTLDIPPDIPLAAGNVSYVMHYELYDVAGVFGPAAKDYMFTENGFLHQESRILHPNDHLYVTLFKIGSTLPSYNQAEVQGALDSYVLSGSSFAYTKKKRENTNPATYDDQVVNVKEVTLPANSAIYVSEMFPGSDFSKYAWAYLYGEQALVVNHSSAPKVFKPGEIVYTLRPYNTPEQMGEVHLRLSIFDGEFNEADYRTLSEKHKVLFEDKWVDPQK